MNKAATITAKEPWDLLVAFGEFLCLGGILVALGFRWTGFFIVRFTMLVSSVRLLVSKEK